MLKCSSERRTVRSSRIKFGSPKTIRRIISASCSPALPKVSEPIEPEGLNIPSSYNDLSSEQQDRIVVDAIFLYSSFGIIEISTFKGQALVTDGHPGLEQSQQAVIGAWDLIPLPPEGP